MFRKLVIVAVVGVLACGGSYAYADELYVEDALPRLAISGVIRPDERPLIDMRGDAVPEDYCLVVTLCELCDNFECLNAEEFYWLCVLLDYWDAAGEPTYGGMYYYGYSVRPRIGQPSVAVQDDFNFDQSIRIPYVNLSVDP